MNRMVVLALLLFSCNGGGIKPAEIFPEDACANCRMAVSDRRFASEIIDDGNEAFKFDDIGCMMKFRSKHSGMNVTATFLTDFDTKEWIPNDRAVIIETDVETPMGSGKLAFSDSARAGEFQRQHLPDQTVSARDEEGMGRRAGVND